MQFCERCKKELSRKTKGTLCFTCLHPPLPCCKNCGKTLTNRTRTGLCKNCYIRLIKVKFCRQCGKKTAHKGKTGLCWSCYLKSVNNRKGEQSATWKGGRVYSYGYVLVKCPKHSRANNSGYVREHILVWEQTHHKYLPMDWLIHHLNGLRDDNRPENLLAMPKPQHKSGTFIRALQRRIRELDLPQR